MRYRIRHTSCYQYSQPVSLSAHQLRLRPRTDAAQTLQAFELKIEPQPQRLSRLIELEGNEVTALWFAPQKTERLWIEAVSEVETHRTNPFDYLSEPWAVNFPLDYPALLLNCLKPYLGTLLDGAIAPEAVQLAQALQVEAKDNLGYFLTALTQTIYHRCQYTIRPAGSPLPAGLTWSQQSGSCRDFAVLFMAACRALGLAARFVSGYQEGDATNPEAELHAWAEVYVPGGGWRGFDPTHGLAVADRHIAVAAAAHPRQAAPIVGTVQEGGSATAVLETGVQVELLSA